MNFYSHTQISEVLPMIRESSRELALASVRMYGVYVREDGSIFTSDSGPKSISAKRKAHVVAVVQPEIGWSAN